MSGCISETGTIPEPKALGFVMFRTASGRTLIACHHDQTMDRAEDMDAAVQSLAIVCGIEPADGLTHFHVNTRHIVEWWER